MQRIRVFPGLVRLLAGSVLVSMSWGSIWAASFNTGDLVISRVEYQGDPTIFNDPSISGIQGQIFLDEYGTAPQSGVISTLPLNGISTSFSSKSEGALTRSVDGHYLTYMGYQAAPGTEGVSNSYTPGANPPGNSNPTYNREVAVVPANGAVSLTPESNAFSGDNPRAVVSVNGHQFYMAGNSDKTPPADSTIGIRYGTPGSDTSFQLGKYTAPSIPNQSAGNITKDNNWRGVGIANGSLYVSKGSGGNGINGIFQVGSGIPTTGGQTIRELPGFPTTPAATTNYFPFGFWFANSNTLYVADEGNGSLAPDPLAGLQKWSLSNGTWSLDYTLQNGLALDVLKSVVGYPVQTATTGLRNLTGMVNADGSVSIYAVTAQYSSISGGEPDPTELVGITDPLSATSLPGGESFTELQDSGAGEVFRGVAFAPTPTPEPSTVGLLGLACVMAVALRHKLKS